MNPGVYGPLDSATNLYTGLPINKQMVSTVADGLKGAVEKEDLNDLHLELDRDFRISIVRTPGSGISNPERSRNPIFSNFFQFFPKSRSFFSEISIVIFE